MTLRDVVEIQLTQGLFALVDQADAEAVLARKWHARRDGNTFYASTAAYLGGGRKNQRQAHVHLHTFLTGWPMVDHVNRNGLDNRRANLRPATKRQNAQNAAVRRDNKLGLKGVWLHKETGKYRARITVESRQISLGLHVTPEDAARAYDAAAREHFGEFAWLNYPEEN